MTHRSALAVLAAGAFGFGWLGAPTNGYAAEPADIEGRLRALEDHVAIEQLLMRYAAALNTRDADTYVSLFTPDAQFELRRAIDEPPFLGPFRGRDALRKQWFPEGAGAVGACAGAGLVAIVGWLGEAALKKEAMGMGDVTLMAFAGAALGPTRAIMTVFLGAMIAAVAFPLVLYPLSRIRRRSAVAQTELALGASGSQTPLVPFGVFLAPAALLTLLWGDAMRAWLMRG